MIDPRASVVTKRLSGVRQVISFCSAKGGVGKTLCAAAAAVTLSRAGYRVGILDLDLPGASVHVFLGLKPRFPEEDRGILPLAAADGLVLMSAAAFTGEKALPLRGAAVSDAMLEMLAVTRWGALDFLLVDMPPGIGEEILDLARMVPRLKALVISTPARVSVAVVERLISVLLEMKVEVSGIIANMTRAGSESVRELARRSGVPFAGEVPFDDSIEDAVGDTSRLAKTAAAGAVFEALEKAGLAARR